MPKLDTLASSEASIVALLDGFHARLTPLALPTSHQGPTLPDLITALAKKYAEIARIDTFADIIKAIEYCIGVQAVDSVQIILARVLEDKKLKELESNKMSWSSYSYYLEDRNKSYPDRVIVPLMSKLRHLALKYSILLPLAPAFRMIARAYTQQVLGYLPNDPSTTLVNVRSWSCSCSWCNSVRTFLLSNPQEQLRLERIGEQAREHLEGNLSRYATSEGTSWKTITTNPRGILVTLFA